MPYFTLEVVDERNPVSIISTLAVYEFETYIAVYNSTVQQFWRLLHYLCKRDFISISDGQLSL